MVKKENSIMESTDGMRYRSSLKITYKKPSSEYFMIYTEKTKTVFANLRRRKRASAVGSVIMGLLGSFLLGSVAVIPLGMALVSETGRAVLQEVRVELKESLEIEATEGETTIVVKSSGER